MHRVQQEIKVKSKHIIPKDFHLELCLSDFKINKELSNLNEKEK